jgi:hypothetical protein
MESLAYANNKSEDDDDDDDKTSPLSESAL